MLDGNRRFIPAGAAVLLPWGQDENPTLKAPLAKVTAKWAFLSSRITDLQQTNVPFITDLYGRQIIDSLLATANAT